MRQRSFDQSRILEEEACLSKKIILLVCMICLTYPIGKGLNLRACRSHLFHPKENGLKKCDEWIHVHLS